MARLSEFLGRQTNNFAEYAGLLAVLRWALENGAKHLRVVSDSELMVKQMKGIYKVKNPGLVPLWEEAKRLAASSTASRCATPCAAATRKPTAWPMKPWIGAWGKSRDRRAENRDQCRDREAPCSRAPPPIRPNRSAPTRQVFEGLVKNGVVHLIEGELPDGILVKIIRE